MATIQLNKQLQRVEIKEFEISNTIVYNYFDTLPLAERDEKLLRALYIGVLALMEDRLSAFLAKTQNELGTELESLKIIFDMKKELFYKSTVKGTIAETEIAEFLNQYFSEKKLKDKAAVTGNEAGNLPGNKTGDIVCEVNGESDKRIAIECKFDKSVKLGDIESKEISTRKSDTAWSQLLETQANRDAGVSLIVFDISLIDNSILKVCDNVAYIQGVGFIAVVDSQKGNYSNLAIAYLLARDILLNARAVELDKDILKIIMTRLIKDLTGVLEIKKLVQANIDNNLNILKQLDKGLLLLEFNQKYLMKFLSDGKLSKPDLLNFYQGEELKDQFKSIEKEIDELAKV